MHPGTKHMASQATWIAHGKPLPPHDGNDPGAREDHALHSEGMVKLVVGPDGTEVKWSVFTANWSSLFHVIDWIDAYPAPFTLKYFLVGWFEEVIESATEARDRKIGRASGSERGESGV